MEKPDRMSDRCLACGVRVKATDSYCRRCGARAPQAPLPAADQTTLSLSAYLRQQGAASEDDEEVELWQGTFSWKGMIREGCLAAILSVVLFALRRPAGDPQLNTLIVLAVLAIWSMLLGLLIYRKLDMHYTITNHRLLHRHGILHRRSDRIEVIDIDDLRCEQNLLEQLLGVGRIVVHASDTSHDELALRGIDRVADVLEILEKVRRRERLQHGLHVEAL